MPDDEKRLADLVNQLDLRLTERLGRLESALQRQGVGVGGAAPIPWGPHGGAALLAWCRGQAANLLATGSLLAIAVGCWMAWPPLGLIVPGGVVLGCLVLGRLRG